MAVGTKIKALRRERGLTQAALAEGIVTRGMLSQIESGAANPSMPTLSALAERLCVSPAFLLDENPSAPRMEWGQAVEQITVALRDKDPVRVLALLSDAGLTGAAASADLTLYCRMQLAMQHIHTGDYTSAARELDLAAPHLAQQTLSFLFASDKRYSFLRSLIENAEHPEALIESASDTPDFLFMPALFFTALRWLQNGRRDAAEALTVCGALTVPYADFIRAEVAHSDRNYVETLLTLKRLCADESCPLFLSILSAAALENCCRECEDYKGAYENQLRYRELLGRIR